MTLEPPGKTRDSERQERPGHLGLEIQGETTMASSNVLVGAGAAPPRLTKPPT